MAAGLWSESATLTEWLEAVGLWSELEVELLAELVVELAPAVPYHGDL